MFMQRDAEIISSHHCVQRKRTERFPIRGKPFFADQAPAGPGTPADVYFYVVNCVIR